MNDEFCLSEKRRIFKEGEEIWTDGTNEVLLVEDVKEFIRRLKEIPMFNMTIYEINERIDKLTGEELLWPKK